MNILPAPAIAAGTGHNDQRTRTHTTARHPLILRFAVIRFLRDEADLENQSLSYSLSRVNLAPIPKKDEQIFHADGAVIVEIGRAIVAIIARPP